jgi:ADP-ribose pyrophosphatase YjhB (NUDIX family)
MQRIVPGVMVVILSEDRQQILLHMRTDNNLWSLPGGSAEFGESAHQLIGREVVEETGITVEFVRAFGIYSQPEQFTFRYPDGNIVHSFVLGVECKKSGGVERSNSADSSEVRWFPVASLPPNIMEMQKQVISDALCRQEFALR